MNPAALSLAQSLGHRLQQLKLRITCAESCTGGGIASAITDVAGSSGWFDAGFVTYSNWMKRKVLGVDESLIERHGAVSEEVAEAMARGAIAVSQADIALATSGIAGPSGGSDDKPVGTVCLAAVSAQAAICKTMHFSGSRADVREQSVACALEMALELLNN